MQFLSYGFVLIAGHGNKNEGYYGKGVYSACNLY